MPLIGRGALCWLCVAEGNLPADGQFRAGLCARHWHRETWMGRVPPPSVEEPWEDTAERELAGLRFFRIEEWAA